MLKRDITYENFDGEQVTETFYFNLSKPELLELQVEYKQGFVEMIQEIIKTEDTRELVRQFKQLILLAYGIKTPDGKRFIKTEELKQEFSQTGAYNTLFMELAMDDKAAAIFIQGILPRDMAGDFQLQVAAAPQVAPVPPMPPVPPSQG